MKATPLLLLILLPGIIGLSSCSDNDISNEPASNCPDATFELDVFEPITIKIDGVMLGSERMYRIRGDGIVSGICTADHIYLTTTIDVVDTAKKYITLESTAVTVIGNAGITFPMVKNVKIGNETIYQSNHQGFLINNIYPAPGPGAIEAGINVRFQSFGSAEADSIFFYKNVSDYKVKVEYSKLP